MVDDHLYPQYLSTIVTENIKTQVRVWCQREKFDNKLCFVGEKFLAARR